MNRKIEDASNSAGNQEPQAKKMKSCSNLANTGVTKVEKIKFSYTWVIENFKDIVREPGEKICSTKFSSDLKKEDKWCLKLYPNGDKKENEGYLSIYLMLVSTKQTKEQVTYNISIRNSIGFTGSDNFGFGKDQFKGWGRAKFFKRDEMFKEGSKFLTNGTLTINCIVEKVNDIVTKTKTTSFLSEIRIPNSTLAEQLSLAVRNETFGDVLFKIGRSKLRASKTILAARSPVFAGMFSHKNMKENQKNQVDITDMKEDVFRELLVFIYTDTAPNLNEMPEELLAAAEKYQLDRLKIMCEKALYEKISIENVVEIFVLSEMYNAEKLRDATLKFMKGHESELFETNGYKSLQKSNNHQALKLCKILAIGNT